MGAPDRFPARYFDGDTAARESVVVRVLDAALEINTETASVLWPFAELLFGGPDPRRGWLRLKRVRGQGERLAVSDPDGQLRDRLRRLAPKTELGRAPAAIIALRALVFAAASISFASALYVLIPRAASAALAAVPPQVETAFGERIFARLNEQKDSFLGPYCEDEPAQILLQSLTSDLAAIAEPGFEVRAELRQTVLANAFALPGGRVVVTTGLLEEMDSPDQLAGVLAHEIGHVKERHGFAGFMTRLGMSMVITLVGGGGSDTAGVMAGRLLTDLNYSRNAEREADAIAVDVLRASTIELEPLARLFDAFADKTDDRDAFTPADLLSTHPYARERAAVIRNAEPVAAPRPALAKADWDVLRAACSPDWTANADETPAAPSERDVAGDAGPAMKD